MGDAADAIDRDMAGALWDEEEGDDYLGGDPLSGTTITAQGDGYSRETATWRPKGRPAMLISEMTDAHLHNAMLLFERRGQTDSVLYRNLLREKMYRDLTKERKDGYAKG